MTREYTASQLRELLTTEADGDSDWLVHTTATVNRWLARGDGVAIYINQDMASSNYGHRQITSYGSQDAQLEMERPPARLPDIGGEINWRYMLEGTYQGEPLEEAE